jgi:hypothetical protein
MDDAQIHETITRLVDEEHRLRAGTHAPEHADRLRKLEESLDQCWDLLRRRQALRESGADPDEARPRPIPEVEGYLQ